MINWAEIKVYSFQLEQEKFSLQIVGSTSKGWNDFIYRDLATIEFVSESYCYPSLFEMQSSTFITFQGLLLHFCLIRSKKVSEIQLAVSNFRCSSAPNKITQIAGPSQ